MTGIYLTDLAAWLRDAGVDVIEVDGWQTRARSSGGYTHGLPWCVMWHHTASPASWHGQKDADYCFHGAEYAPLANIYLAPDGVAWVGAAGCTNTNGSGGPLTVSRGTVPVDSMNSYAVGVEMGNDGVGELWPQVQVDAMFKISNAVNRACGNEPEDLASHAMWAPHRKIDPAQAAAVCGPWRPQATNSAGTWRGADIRNEARRRWSSAPIPTPPPSSEDDDMYLATLTDGTVVVVGSSVRPVSGDEIAPGGPLADLPRHTPDPASYWHGWLAAASAEYSKRVMG